MMRKYGFKIKLVLCTMLMALVFSGYTVSPFDEEVDFGEVDKDHFVYDLADAYSNSEEQKLQEKCEKIGKKLGLDIIVVTTDNLGFDDDYPSDGTIDWYESQYSEAFYLNGGFDDGILYLLDLDYDGIYVTRSGFGEVYIDDADNEEILDAIWEDFLDYDYYDAAVSFIDEVEDIVAPRLKDDEFEDLKDEWEDGGYVYYDDFYIDYRDVIKEAHEDNLFTPFRSFGTCLLVGMVIGGIVVIIVLVSHGSNMTAGSRTYMKSGSFRMLQRFDRYTHTTTHSYTVQTTNNSSGGGFGGGISSSHRSSFGGSSRSFSGGGRRR